MINVLFNRLETEDMEVGNNIEVGGVICRMKACFFALLLLEWSVLCVKTAEMFENRPH